MRSLRVSFGSNLDELFLVSLIVNPVCRRLGLDEILAYQIELCAVEAVTNVIRHGYHLQPGHEVTMLLRFDGKRIELEIVDAGDAMEPYYLARLQNGSDALDFDPSDIRALPENGMGLAIIHQVMDAIAYESASGTNRLTLTKILPADTVNSNGECMKT